MELSIDTASELASIALSNEGVVVAEESWRCQRNHTVELLPAIDRMLSDNGATTADLTAVFVCTGPGMYTGLRVGVTTAKAFAYALSVPIVGVGRLELDAWPHRTSGHEIMTVHNAGRGDLAWASYKDGPWREMTEPALNTAGDFARTVEGAVVVGEIDDDLLPLLRKAVSVIREPIGRAPALAELGYARLAAGDAAEPALLAPIYLRPPAIGPQG